MPSLHTNTIIQLTQTPLKYTVQHSYHSGVVNYILSNSITYYIFLLNLEFLIIIKGKKDFDIKIVSFGITISKNFDGDINKTICKGI